MKASIQVASYTWPGGDAAIGPTLARIGRAADEGGFDTVWVMDHFFQIEGMLGTVESPMLEGYSALSFLAGVTERVRLGTLVTGVIYRHPGYLAKTVTALDVVSGGRAWLGIGAAWYRREADGLGFPFPPLGTRFEQLEETLQILLRMWRDDRSPFEGNHFRLAEPINRPQVVSDPHPPVLIGGGGEQRTLRLVARYGDACNLFAYVGPAAIRRKFDVLRRYCDEQGRNYDDISKTVAGVIYTGQPAGEVVEQCSALAAIGADHVIINVADDHQITPLETLSREVLPALADL
jgi:F420-dependent oxidoreductase-like protein